MARLALRSWASRSTWLGGSEWRRSEARAHQKSFRLDRNATSPVRDLMGLDILDLFFRLERTFQIRIDREDVDWLLRGNAPPDIMAGDLFQFVRGRIDFGALFMDEEIDADSIWPMFQHVVSDSLGVEPAEVTKDKWIIRELGA